MRCSVSTSSAMTFSCSMGSGIGNFFDNFRSLGTWTDFPMANIATVRCTFLFHGLNSMATDVLLGEFSSVIEQYISSAPPGIPAIAAFDFPDGTYVDGIH